MFRSLANIVELLQIQKNHCGPPEVFSRCISGLGPFLLTSSMACNGLVNRKCELLDTWYQLMQIANKSKKWCIWFPKFGSRYQIFPWQVVWAVIHLLIKILKGAGVLYIESICKGGTQFLKISLLSFDNCWTRGHCWPRGHLSDMARGHFVRQGDMDNVHGNEQIWGVYTRRTNIS